MPNNKHHVVTKRIERNQHNEFARVVDRSANMFGGTEPRNHQFRTEGEDERWTGRGRRSKLGLPTYDDDDDQSFIAADGAAIPEEEDDGEFGSQDDRDDTSYDNGDILGESSLTSDDDNETTGEGLGAAFRIPGSESEIASQKSERHRERRDAMERKDRSLKGDPTFNPEARRRAQRAADADYDAHPSDNKSRR